MTETADGRVEPVVAAALGRAVLLGRALVTVATAAAGLAVADDRPYRLVVLIVVLVVASAAQIAVLTRWPRVVAHPVAILAAEAVLLFAVLALSRGGVPYFVHAAGSAALAGVLLGAAAWPLWTAQAAQGYAVCVTILRETRPDAAVAVYLVAAPVAGVLAGVAAAIAARALIRQMRLNVMRVAIAQRDAAALERARLARELHDSVAKTLRGMSLAAVALPGSVRRQPALAEQLAGAISEGAAAASLQARELLEGLRLDSPDEALEVTLDRLCGRFSARTGIDTSAQVHVTDLPVPVRYELTRIAHEALTNIERHANAGRVTVTLALTRRGRAVTLTVRDDGDGFTMPADLLTLQDLGHHGIVGMAERARTIGGGLEVVTRPGRGTSVHVQVPLAGSTT
ncbi:sensor histidine kinase [Catenuloplanes atrovinosus]|uniref:Signal transduction histidine kinase n=1 Tax=Catenuloplanes atrovinosus TaxID=137266 RepID=A0AAE3YID1_9ACTN|nr:histidine kinase [Catenuloplanes atrovinosus]MDR7274249.1 signal transduction histidine kinase [Catenuloplanes atrovinosus]